MPVSAFAAAMCCNVGKLASVTASAMNAASHLPTVTCRHGQVHIVDDDEAVRTSLVLLACAQGWRTYAYASASEFLDASVHIEQPACLVLDLQMPGMDGARLCEKLLERGHDLPTLVLTAWPGGELARRAVMAGAREVIAKPCDPMLWLQAVERALAPGPGGASHTKAGSPG